MPNIGDIYSGDRLKADDLKKPDGTYARIQAVVEQVKVVEVRSGRDENSPMVNKIEIWLVGKEKSIIVNKTNAQNLAMMFGPMTEDWIGGTIAVSVHMTPMGPGLRLDPLQPRPAVQPVQAGLQAQTGQYQGHTEVPGQEPVLPDGGGPDTPVGFDEDDDIPF